MNRKRLISIFAGVMAAIMLLSLLASIIPAVSAASSSELKKELNDLKADREKIQDEIDNLEGQIDENMSEIEKLCDYAIIIDHGRMLYSGNISELKNQFDTDSIEKAFVCLTGDRNAASCNY